MYPFPVWMLTSRIGRAEDRTRDVRRDVVDVQRQLRDLTQEVERLSCVVVALAELARDQLGISAEAINHKIQEVELRGAKLTGVPKRCPECGRVNAPDRKFCMFCAAALPDVPLIPEAGIGPAEGAVTP
jgi:hypothetical protein